MSFYQILSQEKTEKRYNNGNIRYEGFVVNNTFDSIYKEYYRNGVLKEEGSYKNCKYKLNNRSILRLGCVVGNNKDSISIGKRNGEWKSYYENGKLKSVSNYFCGIEQGNFYYYFEQGTYKNVDFYNAGKLIMSQLFYENQTLNEIIYYDIKWIKNKSYKTIRTVDFFENGDYASETIKEEKEDGFEYESYKEYYPNGFLKTENIIIDGERHGICYEYYENGNVKHVGFFEYDKPVYVQLFYNGNGTPNKLERWKKGKVISTENNFDSKKLFKYTVKKYKD